MKKRDIKVIKRHAEDAAPPAPSAEELLAQQQKDEADEHREMADNVKTWISERRENSKAEESDATKSLFGWDTNGSTEPA